MRGRLSILREQAISLKKELEQKDAAKSAELFTLLVKPLELEINALTAEVAALSHSWRLEEYAQTHIEDYVSEQTDPLTEKQVTHMMRTGNWQNG